MLKKSKNLKKGHYENIAHVSKWIFYELVRSQYNHSKFLSSSLNEKIIKLLIPFVKDIKILNQGFIHYCKVIRVFGKKYSIELIKLFECYGANIENNILFKLAIKYYDYNLIELLICLGANVHSQNDYALRRASQNGHLDIVKLLIDNGANKKILKRSCYNQFCHII